MPKIIELTVEIDVHRVSCPGVWLCQDGRVSLTVFTLGTSYQTCMLPPIFPLMFKDVFYFRKRFQESCALNNICCLLKDETVYCELVQWSEDCTSGPCTVLAQYLGSLNDVLFPPNLCSNDGVDLLMRRAKEFPGILSPKIEIATKVRIDELWNPPHNVYNSLKASSCHCTKNEMDSSRQRQVCHSAQYHRNKCSQDLRRSPSRSRSRSRSTGSQSCCSLPQNDDLLNSCRCSKKHIPPPSPRAHHSRPRYCSYNVYNVDAPEMELTWKKVTANDAQHIEDEERLKETKSNTSKDRIENTAEEKLNKILLESRYIDNESCDQQCKGNSDKLKKYRVAPCVCEICKRYHELFHTSKSDS